MVDPRRVKVDSDIGLFLHGFVAQRAFQSAAREEVKKLILGTAERFEAEQNLDILAVERGFNEMGFKVDENGDLEMTDE